MRLRRNEFCPIHKSISCCGRENLPKPRLIRLGVQRVEGGGSPSPAWVPRTPITGRDEEAVEQENRRTEWDMPNLP